MRYSGSASDCGVPRPVGNNKSWAKKVKREQLNSRTDANGCVANCVGMESSSQKISHQPINWPISSGGHLVCA